MHWLSTVAVISTTAVAVQNIPDVITFPGILQTYTHALILGKELVSGIQHEPAELIT